MKVHDTGFRSATKTESFSMDKEQLVEAALTSVDGRETAFEEACVAYASAESDYRVEFARAYLAAEGTEKARNSEAIIKVERYLRERDKTEAVKEFTKEKLKDAQTAVFARQTLLNAALLYGVHRLPPPHSKW